MTSTAQGPHRRAVPCPSCRQNFFPQSLRFHLKSCLVKQQHVELPCPFCDTPVKRHDLEAHTSSCRKRKTAKRMSVPASPAAPGCIPCAICQRSFSSDRITKHQTICRQQAERAKRRKSQVSTPLKETNQRRPSPAVRNSLPANSAWRQKRDAQKEAFERVKMQNRKSMGKNPSHEIVGVDLDEADETSLPVAVSLSESSRCSTNDTAGLPVDAARPATMVRVERDEVYGQGKWARSSPVELRVNDESSEEEEEGSAAVVSDSACSEEEEEEEHTEVEILSEGGSSVSVAESIECDAPPRSVPSPPRRSPPPASSHPSSSRTQDSVPAACPDRGPLDEPRSVQAIRAANSGGRQGVRHSDDQLQRSQNTITDGKLGVVHSGERLIKRDQRETSSPSARPSVQRNLRGWLATEDSDLQDALDRASVALAKARSLRPDTDTPSSDASTPLSVEDGSPPPLVHARRPKSLPAWELEVHLESPPKERVKVVHYHHHHHHHYLPEECNRTSAGYIDPRVEERERNAVESALRELTSRGIISSPSKRISDGSDGVRHLSYRHLHHHRSAHMKPSVEYQKIVAGTVEEFGPRPSTADYPQRMRSSPSSHLMQATCRHLPAPGPTRQYGA